MEAVLDKETAPTGADTQEAGAKPKVHKRWVIFGAIALAVLAAAGIYVLLTSGKESTDDAQIQTDIIPIAPRVGGMVLHVAVHNDEQVKKGQVLFEIDPSDYQAQLQKAQAELGVAQAKSDAADAQFEVVKASAKGGFSSAQAVVSGSSVGVSSAEAQIAAAKAAQLRAQAEAQKAKLDLARAEQLRRANAIPQERLDNARIENQAAQAALAQADAQLKAAEEAKAAAVSRLQEAQGRLSATRPIDQQIAAAKAQADLAHAQVKAAEAALTLAQDQLRYTKVLAPADGTLSTFHLQEGTLLQPGQVVAPLVRDDTFVTANFKETQIGDMRPGNKVEVTVDAYPGKTLVGRVTSISQGTGAEFALIPPDNASGNFVKVVQRVPVRIDWIQVPDNMPPLRAGLSVDVTVYLGTKLPPPAQMTGSTSER